MNKDKALQAIGLAMRAKKVIHGEDMVLMAIRSGLAKLVFLASDTAPTTTKRITDKSTFYQIRLVTMFSSDELSKAIGKENRKVLALIEPAFVRMIEPSLTE
jgi:ribosomal protein L7Ae-like RNA K-turn-binding protein